MDYVRDQILETVKTFQEKPVDAARLDTVRKRLRYSVRAAAWTAATRSPESWRTTSRCGARRRRINKLYDQYAALTPEDVQKAAAKYLVENGRTMVTLTGRAREAASEDCCSRSSCSLAAAAHGADPRRRTAGKSPLVTFRIVFTTGLGRGSRRQAGPRDAHGDDARRWRHEGPDLQTDRRRAVPHGRLLRRPDR